MKDPKDAVGREAEQDGDRSSHYPERRKSERSPQVDREGDDSNLHDNQMLSHEALEQANKRNQSSSDWKDLGDTKRSEEDDGKEHVDHHGNKSRAPEYNVGSKEVRDEAREAGKKAELDAAHTNGPGNRNTPR